MQTNEIRGAKMCMSEYFFRFLGKIQFELKANV